jgi:hypothetical protein
MAQEPGVCLSLQQPSATSNPPVTVWCASVRRREWTSMVSVYSCVRLLRLLSSRMTNPPPSTVSMVRASRLGVRASKSCGGVLGGGGGKLGVCFGGGEQRKRCGDGCGVGRQAG